MVRNCLAAALLEECLAVRYWPPKKIPTERVCTLRACVYCTLWELATFYRRFMGIPAQPLRYATRSKSQQQPGNAVSLQFCYFSPLTQGTQEAHS